MNGLFHLHHSPLLHYMSVTPPCLQPPVSDRPFLPWCLGPATHAWKETPHPPCVLQEQLSSPLFPRCRLSACFPPSPMSHYSLPIAFLSCRSALRISLICFQLLEFRALPALSFHLVTLPLWCSSSTHSARSCSPTPSEFHLHLRHTTHILKGGMLGIKDIVVNNICRK